jgi:hypothetical protein
LVELVELGVRSKQMSTSQGAAGHEHGHTGEDASGLGHAEGCSNGRSREPTL